MSFNNHAKRILTSILLLPLLILIIYVGNGWLFNILITLCIIICLREFYALMDQGDISCFKLSAMVLGVILALAFWSKKIEWVFLVLTGSGLILFLNALISSSPLSKTIPRVSATFFGLFYIPWMMGFLMLIRGLKGGRYLVFFILALIWSGDTLAYYTGILFGRHPLCKNISPKKTVEGMVGGLLGSVIAAFCLGPFWLPEISFLSYPLIGLAMGAFGQLGDLSESVLKRWAGAKESGAILPGHGGLLDRIDGLIFSAPVFYYYLILSALGRRGF